MKQYKIIIACMLMLASSVLYAGQPPFSIIPVAGSTTSFLLPGNFTETTSYQVTNQTKTKRILTMVPITGINQVTGSGNCANPFILSPGQSCTLALTINASQVPATGINGGPVICKTKAANNNAPDPFLCSQPDVESRLAISVTTSLVTVGQYAYIANQFDNTVSFCQANPATGLLTQCSVTATGLSGLEGIGFNPAGTLFYSANASSNSISVCQLNQSTGALSGCIDAGGSGFNLPNAIAFSPDGTILYTSNLGGSASVSACLVNATSGQLSACVTNNSPTFSASADMALNASGTLAYVANRSANTISVCNVSAQVVNSCNDLSGSGFNEPEGVTISPDGLHAYIANAGSKQIIVCDILQDGTGLLANCSATNGAFDGTGNVGLNNLGTLAYVPNQLLNAVFVCNVTKVNGELSSCLPSTGTGFVGPAGVVLH